MGRADVNPPAAASLPVPATPVPIAANDSAAALKREQQTPAFAAASKATPALADRMTTNEIAEVPPVLASFRLEQDGRTIRLVDSDGSIYTGQLQTEMAESAAAPAAPNPPAASVRAFRSGDSAALRSRGAGVASAENAATHTFSFRVAGTNRSLAKPVVFSGALVTSRPGFAVGTNQFKALVAGGTTPGISARTNSATRVLGKAVIGGSREIEINAQAAAP
jgi:hypothetical protein